MGKQNYKPRWLDLDIRANFPNLSLLKFMIGY